VLWETVDAGAGAAALQRSLLLQLLPISDRIAGATVFNGTAFIT